MSKKASVKSPKTKIFTEENENHIIQAIYDDNKMSLFKYSREGETFEEKCQVLESIEQMWQTLYPIDYHNSFIKSDSIKLFWLPEEYDSKYDLLCEIQEYIQTYVDCSDEFLLITSYYVLMTYCYRNFQEIPYLRILWDYGSGKSRFLKVVGSICYNAIQMNGSASTASIFRIMDVVGWTFIFDEADFRGSDTTNDIVKILNNGFQKWQCVFRADWDDLSPRAFNVFCPKIIGGRQEFSDKAVESRCLSEVMKQTKRKDIGELDDKFYEKSQELRNKLFKYKLDIAWQKTTLIKYDLSWLEPRLKQILKPILSLIDEWLEDHGKQIINFMLLKQNELTRDRQMSLDWVILKILSEWFLWEQSEKVALATIVGFIKDIDDYKQSRITSRTVSGILKQYWIYNLKRTAEWMNVDYIVDRQPIEDALRKFELLPEDYDKGKKKEEKK